MNNTLIAGPHQAQYVGTLQAFARTVSYSHRIRAIARTAALKTHNVPEGSSTNRRNTEVPAPGPSCLLTEVPTPRA